MGLSSGGETKTDPSGWSTDTLKTYVERLFEEHDKRYEQRFISQQQNLKDALASSNMAVDKAEVIAEKWRQNANEWRAAMSDRDRAYLTKEAADIKFASIDKALDDAKQSRIRIEGKSAGLSEGWGFLVGAVGFGVAIATIVFYVVNTLRMVGK